MELAKYRESGVESDPAAAEPFTPHTMISLELTWHSSHHS